MATLTPIVDGTTATAAQMNASLNALNADLGLPLALTGATAATRYVGGTTSGAPASGPFAVGDFVIDQTGKVWVCTTAGSPGAWTQVGASSGGLTAADAAAMGIQAGVYTDTAGMVTQKAAGANMSFDVAAGTAWVPDGSGGLVRVAISAQNVSAGSAASTNPRVDTVVVNSSGSVSRRQGSEQAGATLDNAAGTTSRVTLASNELRLAEFVIGTSTTSLPNSNIRDRRTSARLSSVGLVSTLPTAPPDGYTVDYQPTTTVAPIRYRWRAYNADGSRVTTPGWDSAVEASTYSTIIEGGDTFPSGTSSARMAGDVMYLDPADYAVSGKTVKYRVRLSLLTGNNPGVTYTVGLYPVTGSNVGGVPIFTPGAVTAGSTAAVAASAGGTFYVVTGADFTPPAAGYYQIGWVSSGTTSGNAKGTLVLQVREV